jgi:hypothetical protein
MGSEEKIILQRVVEHFLRTGETRDDQVKVTSLPKGKSSYVEQNGDVTRSIMLEEYKVDGKVIRAGYSSRSGTVYLSPLFG